MKWAKERDLLIAQTMAFVQSLGGKKPEAEARPEFTAAERTLAERTAVDEAREAEPPVETVPMARPRPVLRNDVREEIQGRVAAFRAHQQLFHRERDAYCNSVLARVRKPADQPPKTPGR